MSDDVPADPVLSALEAVQGDLRERKVLDEVAVERSRRWRREIRIFLAAICLALLLLLVSTGFVLAGLLTSRTNQHFLRENQRRIVDCTTPGMPCYQRGLLTGACLIEQAPDIPACVAAKQRALKK